ncbi:hypothetical protein ACFQ2K_03270 [Streptomyces sanglieri]|uniref:Uncharacterized protein n=1 Tax=Streptomyces sanglieri TaxID=193460 RepID=A0ABW2WKM1_9ACTN
MTALARRETAAVRTGAKVLRAERAAWLNASDETPAHLRAGLLNHRYSTWTSRQQSEAKILEEKAAGLAKQADKLDRQAGQLLAAASADPEDTGKQATALRRQAASLRKEAAGWRKQATEASQRPYTAHLEPAEADLRRHRHRTATRRWAATAALGLAIGWAEIRIGGALLPALTASGITTAAWAKGRFPAGAANFPKSPARLRTRHRPPRRHDRHGPDVVGRAGPRGRPGNADSRRRSAVVSRRHRQAVHHPRGDHAGHGHRVRPAGPARRTRSGRARRRRR